MTSRSYAKLRHPKIHTPQRDRVIALSLKWLHAKKPPENEASLRATAWLKRKLATDLSPVGIPIYEPPLAADIIAQVAAWHVVTVAEIVGDSRAPHLIDARFDAICAVAHNCRVVGYDRRLTLGEIGRQFGNRDHSTIRFVLTKRGVYVPAQVQNHSPEQATG